jgi:predicted SnoaL-like aldol condensation-catalyzing enzyme
MAIDVETLTANKAVVVRFNKEVIEQGNEATFRELMAPEFVNRSAHPGAPTGPEGMLATFNRVLNQTAVLSHTVPLVTDRAS